jgi:hypothetical protein
MLLFFKQPFSFIEVWAVVRGLGSMLEIMGSIPSSIVNNNKKRDFHVSLDILITDKMNRAINFATAEQ